MAAGAKRIPEEPCLWILQNCYIFFYVDDFLITGPSQQIPAVKAILTDIFEMHDIGLARTFLGIQIQMDPKHHSITLHQEEYTNKLLTEFNIEKPRKPALTPITLPLAVL